ncbi:MAG TPA: RdgB/HAM1 family non-canonical purine NTP pyrophosphatase [Actinomycetota bacterium]|nr:RdgB/HAM1 family non-canonical purine NTP pyrophosphatase [Actinomycetota bacterium]
MALPRRIALATKNEHKLVEIIRICSDWPVEWVTVHDRDAGTFPDVDETGETYLDNAALKARAVTDALGIPALADDSGIEVDALGGRPGPRSARFAGPDATDERNLAELIRSVRGVPAAGLTARYRCVAAFVVPGGELISVEGVCEGTLTTRSRGTGGFGYDPIFVPVGWDRTMAELEPGEKDRISHRGRAFRGIRALLTGG